MKIVVALIRDRNGHVLIVKRKPDTDFSGYYEFPGGKVEKGESAIDALTREIREEVGLEIKEARLIDTFHHNYDTSERHFSVFLVEQYTGEAQCLEAQPALKWIPVDTLSNYPFPPANDRMVALLNAI